MVDIEKVISRSEIFDKEEQNRSSDSEVYALPPPGFDFEIVDIDDVGDTEILNTETKSNDDGSQIEQEPEEKVELFNMFSSLDSTSNLVKVKVDNIDANDDNDNPVKYNDEEWDMMANGRNERPISYYFQSETDAVKLNDYTEVAVDGQTIYDWSEKFRIISNYKVINLKEFNSKVNLIYRPKHGKTSKKNNRKSRMRRDAQIFKKERLKNWKKSLKLIQQRLENIPTKDYTMKNPVKYVFQENGERKRIIPTVNKKYNSSKKVPLR